MASLTVGKLVANIMTSERPIRMYGQLLGNSYHNCRDPWHAQFFGRMGKQCLKNRVSKIYDFMKCDCLVMNEDKIRSIVKKFSFTARTIDLANLNSSSISTVQLLRFFPQVEQFSSRRL